MKNHAKLEKFIEIAKQLNAKLNSTPILYGSLGLSISIDHDLETEDIDMLIEHRIFDRELSDIRHLMETLGYKLVNPEENTFRRGELDIGISHDGDMVEFSGVDPEKLTIIESSARYRVLTPNEYLATYKASALDGYRRDERQKNDSAKIELLQSNIGV
jgi:hypothetical protein